MQQMKHNTQYNDHMYLIHAMDKAYTAMYNTCTGNVKTIKSDDITNYQCEQAKIKLCTT